MNEIQINQNSPLAMASEFLKKDSNVDIDKLAKLLDIQERWEANEAKKAYVEAMAAFKADPPKIVKDKHVKYNQTEYHHASLENVTATIGEALSNHGLNASWVTEQGEKTVTVTCRITHILGHSEQTSLSSGPDSSGSKNPIQALGSAVTYLQRYTLLSLVGLATEGQDDDGKATTAKPEPEAIDWTDNRLNFAGIVKKELEAATGEKIDIEGVKRFIADRHRKTGNPIPEDPKDLNLVTKTVNFLSKKTATLNSLKVSA